MSEGEILIRIYEDLELLKRDVAEIREVINLEPELRKEIRLQVQLARERITKGQFVKNKDILKEFDLA